MPKLINRLGEIYDTWEVIEKLPTRKGKVYWKCRCTNCNAILEVQSQALKDNTYRKCECQPKINNTKFKGKTKKCEICGKEFTTIQYGGNRKYCFDCSPNDKSYNAITALRHAMKNKIVMYKGGKCEKCGYDKCIGALQFHHTNPENKKFEISRKINSSHSFNYEELCKEADKCQLLCANCHSEIHWQN